MGVKARIKNAELSLVKSVLRVAHKNVPVLVLWQHNGELTELGTGKMADWFKNHVDENTKDQLKVNMVEGMVNLSDKSDHLILNEKSFPLTAKASSIFKSLGNTSSESALTGIPKLCFPLSLMSKKQILKFISSQIASEARKDQVRVLYGSEEWRPSFWLENDWKWINLKQPLSKTKESHFSGQGTLLDFLRKTIRTLLLKSGLDSEEHVEDLEDKKKTMDKKKRSRGIHEKPTVLSGSSLENNDENNQDRMPEETITLQAQTQRSQHVSGSSSSFIPRRKIGPSPFKKSNMQPKHVRIPMQNIYDGQGGVPAGVDVSEPVFEGVEESVPVSVPGRVLADVDEFVPVPEQVKHELDGFQVQVNSGKGACLFKSVCQHLEALTGFPCSYIDLRRYCHFKLIEWWDYFKPWMAWPTTVTIGTGDDSRTEKFFSPDEYKSFLASEDSMDSFNESEIDVWVLAYTLNANIKFITYNIPVKEGEASPRYIKKEFVGQEIIPSCELFFRNPNNMYLLNEHCQHWARLVKFDSDLVVEPAHVTSSYPGKSGNDVSSSGEELPSLGGDLTSPAQNQGEDLRSLAPAGDDVMDPTAYDIDEEKSPKSFGTEILIRRDETLPLNTIIDKDEALVFNPSYDAQEDQVSNPGLGAEEDEVLSPGFGAEEDELSSHGLGAEEDEVSSPVFGAEKDDVISPGFGAEEEEVSSPGLSAQEDEVSSSGFGVLRDEVFSPGFVVLEEEVSSPGHSVLRDEVFRPGYGAQEDEVSIPDLVEDEEAVSSNDGISLSGVSGNLARSQLKRKAEICGEGVKMRKIGIIKPLSSVSTSRLSGSSVEHIIRDKDDKTSAQKSDLYFVFKIKTPSIDELLQLPSPAEIAREKKFEKFCEDMKAFQEGCDFENEKKDRSIAAEKENQKQMKMRMKENAKRRDRLETELSESMLINMFRKHEQYFDNINKGVEYSERYDTFIKGGAARSALRDRMISSPFTDQHLTLTIGELNRLLGYTRREESIHSDYIWKVLIPECFIKFYQDFFNIGDKAEAERKINETPLHACDTSDVESDIESD